MCGMALLKYYDKWDNRNFKEEERTTDAEGSWGQISSHTEPEIVSLVLEMPLLPQYLCKYFQEDLRS